MIYVLSDIHGHYSRYRSILRQINLQRDDHLYVLGDCIDRNPFGLKILKELYLMSNATVLLGNHEYMMLAMRIYHGNSRIGVDCGCAYPEGRLACLRLDDMKEFYSEPEENDANKSEKAAV